ncbi:hypothetical protein D9613_002432 [Agrocybe pediades]|uniref:Uncharacterized protein n=1 Tax=Agrocybe pediades TaxID=84607 RepID=A0A8H4VKW7_9AGAR|nr:hypothetical protein D9613_002432 [Agrocybe pediades]
MPSSTVRHVMVYLDSLDEVEGAPPARRQAIEDVCPFLDLERILEVGMGDCEDEPEEHEIEHYNALLDLHDDFADLIEEFRGTRREYNKFSNIVNDKGHARCSLARYGNPNGQPTASRSATVPPSQPSSSHRQPAPQPSPARGPTPPTSRTQLQPAPAAVAPSAHHHSSPTVQPAQPAREFRRLQRDRPGGDDTRSDEDNDNDAEQLPSPPPKKMAKRAQPPKRVSARRGRGGKTLN